MSIKFLKQKKIIIPSGYETDGYSKPQVTKALVDGSFGDDIRPAIVHDFLCQYHEFKNEYDGNIVKVSFKRANDIFYQAMADIKMPLWKRIIYRIAVSFNPPPKVVIKWKICINIGYHIKRNG